jgi:CheY-like chemotaxis protein
MLGCHVDLAENGREAVEMAQRSGYDLVLMDWQMPVLDGVQAAQAIRHAKGPNASIPIVAVTAYAMKGNRVTCLAAGMNDYLSKPIHFEELIRVLAKWFGAEKPPL